jgi:hypothetical protein
MIRYYLYERDANGTLHGKGSVIALEEDETRMIIVSSVPLDPQFFREIVLKEEHSDGFNVTYEADISLGGATPRSSVSPFVCQVKRK